MKIEQPQEALYMNPHASIGSAAAAVSITSTLMSWIVDAIPVLQFVALLIAITSGCLSMYATFKKKRHPSKAGE